MNLFNVLCQKHGGVQVGLNADWCISTYLMGHDEVNRQILIQDNEDGTYTVRVWDFEQYARFLETGAEVDPSYMDEVDMCSSYTLTDGAMLDAIAHAIHLATRHL